VLGNLHIEPLRDLTKELREKNLDVVVLQHEPALLNHNREEIGLYMSNHYQKIMRGLLAFYIIQRIKPNLDS
jgi:hypothetical protein